MGYTFYIGGFKSMLNRLSNKTWLCIGYVLAIVILSILSLFSLVSIFQVVDAIIEIATTNVTLSSLYVGLVMAILYLALFIFVLVLVCLDFAGLLKNDSRDHTKVFRKDVTIFLTSLSILMIVSTLASLISSSIDYHHFEYSYIGLFVICGALIFGIVVLIKSMLGKFNKKNLVLFLAGFLIHFVCEIVLALLGAGILGNLTADSVYLIFIVLVVATVFITSLADKTCLNCTKQETQKQETVTKESESKEEPNKTEE